MFKNLKYEKTEKQIAIVTINRPDALNALNSDVIAELEELIAQIEQEETIAAMILTGEGRSFVAGADIVEQSKLDLAGGRKWGQRGSALMRRIENLEFPTIAAVNGFALGGGCEIAMACDIILASEKAKFGQPEVGLGITPGFSGTQRLPRRVGTAMAKELIFSGKMIPAQEAERIGLVNHVYAPERLMEEAVEWPDLLLKIQKQPFATLKPALTEGCRSISTAASPLRTSCLQCASEMKIKRKV